MKPLWTSGRKAKKTDLRRIGRSAWNDDQSALIVWHAGSGIEVAFRGGAVSVELTATPWDVPGKEAHVGVWIDDLEREEPFRTIVVDRESVRFEMADLAVGDHVLRLIKRSEATDSTLWIGSVQTDGEWRLAPHPKPLQIEVVGASNSCGYGTLGPLGRPKTTANSSVFAAFSYQAARRLHADVSIVAASGWGVTRGYNTGGKASLQKTLPVVYDYCGITPQGDATLDHPWTHEADSYQAIVLNMGSNDFNASNYEEMDDGHQKILQQNFSQTYVHFLRHLRAVHPNAWIVCTYGMSNENKRIKSFFERIIQETNADDGKILGLEMNQAGSNGHPFAVDYHPNPETHLENAVKLAECLRSVLEPR